MRTCIQVIRALLGDPTFTDAKPIRERDVAPFQFFRLNLQDKRYHGFLPNWNAAILTANSQRSDSEIAQVYEAARQIISDEKKNHSLMPDRIPMLLISDDDRTWLKNEFTNEGAYVFFVDHRSLPAIGHGTSSPITSPLIKTIRNHLTQPELSALMFSPYIRNRPAEGWRFFGRKKELDRLTDSPESYFVVGGRRIGKTSLLREAARRLNESGAYVIYVDVEACRDEDALVRKILEAVSPKDAAAAVRRQLALGEPLMSSVLRKVTARGGRVVLFLDEIGNLIIRLPSEQWKILGTLREFAQNSQLRIISSCFQELFQRQALDPNGPLVNFGTVMRLRAMTPAEVEDMVVPPLLHWSRIGNAKALLQIVTGSIGRHPLVLQTFCQDLFQTMMQDSDRDALSAARQFIESDADYTACFRDAVDEMFNRQLTPFLRHLFLLCCREADLANLSIAESVIDDDWLETTITGMGFYCRLDTRTALIEELEMRGMVEQKDDRRFQFVIVSPMFYYYHKKAGIQFERLFDKFRRELDYEYEKWGLLRIEAS